MANARTNVRTNARTPRSTAVAPVATLREQVIKLDAAMVVCRATPRKEPVHTLRKATRYVEAQLALLELVPHLPPHANQADKVRKRLKIVRKAAGNIRDFDVQRGLVKDDRPAKSAAKTDSPNDRVRRDAQALAKHLKRQRDDETTKLTALLSAEEKRLAKALRSLEDALEPAAELAVPATRLAASIERWFRAHTPRPSTGSRNGKQVGRKHGVEKMEEQALHALRKTSKLCRYMAESLPAGVPTAKRLSSLFETIQESGGKWHDWLLLQEIAAKRQGKGGALTERYTRHRDTALASYRSHLANLLPINSI